MATATTPEYITGGELDRRVTGATYRQLDYWIRMGVIPSEGPPGSGHHRKIDANLVPCIEIVAKVADAFGRMVTTEVLAQVMTHCDDGCFEMAPGVWITWDV